MLYNEMYEEVADLAKQLSLHQDQDHKHPSLKPALTRLLHDNPQILERYLQTLK